MKKAIVIEDQAILADFLKNLLREHKELEFCGAALDGEAGLKLFEEILPDITILDIELPGMNGIDILSSIKFAKPDAYVVVFTAHPNTRVIRESVKHSADAILEKDTSLEEFNRALDHAAKDERYYTIQVMAEMRNIVANPEPEDPASVLSTREKEVLRLIAESHTNREIAAMLNVSMGTVNTHRWNIMRKLDRHDTAALTRFAIETGITRVSPPV